MKPKGPSRYARLTRTTPFLASPFPSYMLTLVEPPVKPPPWTQTITGTLAFGALAGVHTFRYRQSSLTGEELPCEFAGCMHAFAKASAFLTPDQGWTGAGAFQRKSPTGGAANGIPLKIEMPSCATPLIAPPVTL